MKRSLRLFDVVCLGLNAIIGSGIFLLPDDLFREMGVLSPLAFLLCGLGLLPVALCYAALAKNHDETGGPFLYARDAFGPTIGFGVGFMAYANGIFSFAAVSAAAAAALGLLVPAWSGAGASLATAVLSIAAFSALNYRGARPGALLVDLFTVAKFGVLFVLLLALLPDVGSQSHEPGLPRGASGVGTAVFMALFACQGFEVVGVPAGETRDPRRDVPRAVVGSLVLASLLYVLVQACLVSAFAELGARSDTPLADAVLGRAPALGFVVAVGGLVSAWGFVSGTALGTPRYLFALSVDGHLPRALGRVHPGFQSPHRAVVFTGAAAIVLVSIFDYRALIGMSNVTVAVQYLTTCLAAGRSNRLQATRLPGGLTIPILGSLVSLWIFTEASGEELAWALGTLLLGFLGYWLTRRLSPLLEPETK